MKKIVIISSIVMPILALLIFSCSKENFEPSFEGNCNYGEEVEVFKEITIFSKKINSPLKSSEKMQLKKAIWLTEATLNYHYGYGEKSFNDLVLDSCIIQMNITNDKFVNENDVITAYNKFVNTLKDHYKKVQSVNKNLIFADIELVSEESNFVNLKLTSAIGTISEPVRAYNDVNPFNETDYWWYAGYDGDAPYFGGCGPYHNQPINNLSHAAKEITRAINQRYAYYRNQGPGSAARFFTDVENVRIYDWGIDNSPSPDANSYHNYITPLLNPSDNVPNNNWYDRLYFYESECNQPITQTSCTNWLPNFHTCMNPTEMNYYFHSYVNLSNSPLIKYPSLTFINIYIGWQAWGNAQGLNWLRCCHSPIFSYGKPRPLASLTNRLDLSEL